MFKSLDIQKNMEVVGLDGKHVGTVDHLETADRIILARTIRKRAGGNTSSGSIGLITWTRRSISISHQQKQHRNGRWLPKASFSPENNSPALRRAVRLAPWRGM
jgi:hypothetical protein